MAAVRLYYLYQALHSDDTSLHGILASVCTQVELSYAVIATTMPCLKPFMSALNTGYGGGATFVLSQTTPNTSALQRSRDTAKTTSPPSKAKAKVKAAAAVMSGAGAGFGGSEGRSGSRCESRVRDSTESQTRMLKADERRNTTTNGSGKDGVESEGSLSRTDTANSNTLPCMPQLAPSQTQYVPPPPKPRSGYKAPNTTSTSNTAPVTTTSKSPFGGRSRISALLPRAENQAATELASTQEKNADPTSFEASELSPITPAMPIHAHPVTGIRRERFEHKK